MVHDDSPQRVRRLARRYEELETLNLFSRIETGSDADVMLSDPERVGSFLSSVEGGLQRAVSSSATLHGIRVELLFEQLVAALGRITFMKTEDCGECYYSGAKPKFPDWRIVPIDGDPFLAEVKNYHQPPNSPLKDFAISEGEFHALQAYRDHAAPDWSLKFAIYWSRWNRWTLVPETCFRVANGRAVLPQMEAFMRSEMVFLGDIDIATLYPLSLTLVADPERDNVIDSEGLAQFTIGDLEIRCGGHLITRQKEKNLAVLFMLHSAWTESTEAEVVDNRLRKVTFSFSPEMDEGQMEHQPFHSVGSLSSLYSSIFNHATLTEGGVSSLRVAEEIPRLGTLIPDDYQSDQLPLWRFELHPKRDPIKGDALP